MTEQDLQAQWRESLVDPFRLPALRAWGGPPNRMGTMAPPLEGEPAFDPAMIRAAANELRLPRGVHFESPTLELAVRIGLSHIDATFQGDHPKYGVGAYAAEEHDGFPPTIVAAVDALTAWGLTGRAQALLTYWLSTFVSADGSIRYYGTSLSEYGQILTTVRRLVERGANPDWLPRNASAPARIASRLMEMLSHAGASMLVAGSPEADTKEDVATYFHNNAWIARGLGDWAHLLATRLGRQIEASRVSRAAHQLARAVRRAIDGAWPTDERDWWLRPILEPDGQGNLAQPVGRLTASRLGSYTNYRYWPELLSSGVLRKRQMVRIVRARRIGGGQFLGMTRFEDHLDDWPLVDYLEGLWNLGLVRELRLSLWGHILYHQALHHLTAYEQVSFPPGRKLADYCLPCQLVAPRAAALLMGLRRQARR